MSPVLVSFLKKGAYAVIANLIAALTLGLASHSFVGSGIELSIYAAVVSVLTGAVAALKRFAERFLA